MEKSQPDRYGPALFEERDLAWPPTSEPREPLVTVDAFSERWQLRTERGASSQWWWFCVAHEGWPPAHHTDNFSSLRAVVLDLVERVEVRQGVRCCDCGLRMSASGTDHCHCMPF